MQKYTSSGKRSVVGRDILNERPTLVRETGLRREALEICPDVVLGLSASMKWYESQYQSPEPVFSSPEAARVFRMVAVVSRIHSSNPGQRLILTQRSLE